MRAPSKALVPTEAGASAHGDRDRAADLRIAELPVFSLDATCGTLATGDLNCRRLLLYFYPKDATPGCTTQAESFRDLAPDFANAATRIVGVSRDSLVSHRRFREKHQLPFDLISDTEGELCRLFDVLREKRLYGRSFEGIVRSSFLFDEVGLLRKAWRAVKVPGHAQSALAAVSEL